MVFAAIVAIAFWLAYVDGRAYADDLKQGYAFSPWRFGSFSLQYAPVCIASIEDKQLPHSPLMLLGESQDRLILFEFGEQNRSEGRIVRFPKETVAIYGLKDDLVTNEQFQAGVKECSKFTKRLQPKGPKGERPPRGP